MVHLGLFGEDHPPAALGLGGPHLGRRRRIAVATAVAMRHLIEAVLGRVRADLHRLEEDIIAGIAHGSYWSPGTP